MESSQEQIAPAIDQRSNSSNEWLLAQNKPLSAGAGVLEKLTKGKQLKDQGNEAFKRGDYQDALKHYHWAILHLKGLDHGSLASMIPNATMSLSTKEDIAKTLVSCYNNLAMIHYKREKWAKAIECADAALALDPENPKAYYRKGQTRVALGEYERACKDLKRAAELNPQDRMIRESLSEARSKWQEIDNRAKAELKSVYSRALSASTPS